MTWVGFFNRKMKNTKLAKLLDEIEVNITPLPPEGPPIDMVKESDLGRPVEQEPTTRLTSETVIQILTMVSLEEGLTTFEAFFDYKTNTMTLKGFTDDQ
jgi:hypothetical protein